MNWEFILIDRNGISHAIDEPVGWDGISIEIKRDLDTHGAFFDYSTNDFEFHGKALSIIREEYEEYGIEGNIILVIRQGCNGSIEELYRGKLLFGKYEYTCSSMCFVKIPIETTGDLMDLKNRWDQKVDLQTIKAFDGVTALPAYNKLGFDLNLPSKGILLQNYSVNETDIEESFDGGLQPAPSGSWNLTYGQFEFAMKIKAGEIGGFSFNPVKQVGSVFSGHSLDLTFQNFNFPNLIIDNSTLSTGHPYPPPGLYPLYLDPIVNLYPESANYDVLSNPVQLELSFNGKLEILNAVVSVTAFYLLRLKDRPDLITNGELLSHYDIIYRNVLYDPSIYFPSDPGGYGNGLQSGETLNINATFLDNNFILDKGDRLYLFMTLIERKNQAMLDAVNAGGKAFKLTIYQNSFFKISNLSRTQSSTSKVFAVNEALSRTVEAITNDKIRAYSNYFGRTDSQPYNHTQDGCGSLEIITKGLFVRKQENRIAGQPFAMAVSMQDLWQGLEPIHHVGFGIEADTNRPGYNRLRIEHWKYFYKQDVIMSCDGIASIEKKVIENEHYSTFKFGFEKWEAEEYNGLDEFLTKRQYRTTLNQVKNEFSRLSKFIASGYALEITRRKANIDSKDWRYDNDTFIVCCKRNNAGDIVVELGNIINPQNVLDPATLYNYRISPLRNAMKWLDKVLASYKKTNANNKVIFMDGDGNYHTRGEMESAFCKWENQTLEENHDLDLTIFADATKSTPILKPERIEFEYPLSVKEFKTILSNPYGKIYYSGACEDGYGWIDSIKYKPEEGLADFKLIPNYQ